MDHDKNLASALRVLVAPENMWTLRKTTETLLTSTLRRLPQKEVSENERRYPTSREGLRAFLDSFFARHYFQIQDSLIEYFASPAFESAARRGFIHIADVGSGPAVASLAIIDLASAAMEAMSGMGKLRGNDFITIHCVLNDTSDICLAEGRALLEKYNHAGTGRASVGRILSLSTPFPDSNANFRRIARMTAPYDICCLGYVLVPLSEQIGSDGTAEAIRQLAQVGNSNGGQLLLTQDKFQEDLHHDICRAVGVSAEMTELKQRVYDSGNQNAEYTYTYCRSCSAISEIIQVDSLVAVA